MININRILYPLILLLPLSINFIKNPLLLGKWKLRKTNNKSFILLLIIHISMNNI